MDDPVAKKRACCLPSRPRVDESRVSAPSGTNTTSPGSAPEHEFCRIPAGIYALGNSFPEGHEADGEHPVRVIEIGQFDLSQTPVTNRQFSKFSQATGYLTDAERMGSSLVFFQQIPNSERHRPYRRVAAAPWWLEVPRADWQHPAGPGSDLLGLENHPVVHISWSDAVAYCEWAGVRLPTEDEWEAAARGGLVGARFAWGDDLCPNGEHRCNIWQGDFPNQNDGTDGWIFTSPVDAFPPNGYGLLDMTGNVWEWCGDLFSIDRHNPVGAHFRVTRGGSFLCHESYCDRYRVAARNRTDPETSTSNLGFRVAKCIG